MKKCKYSLFQHETWRKDNYMPSWKSAVSLECACLNSLEEIPSKKFNWMASSSSIKRGRKAFFTPCIILYASITSPFTHIFSERKSPKYCNIAL